MPLQNGHQQFSRYLLVWLLFFVLKPGISQSQPEEYIVETIPFTGELSGLKVISVRTVHFSDPDFKIEQLSTKLHMSRSQVYRKIEAVTGYSPNELIRNLRPKKAAGLFRSGHLAPSFGSSELAPWSLNPLIQS